MKNKKKISAILFALLALICVFTMTAVATEIAEEEPVVPTVVDSGECGAEGDNVLWTFYSDGLLEITGSGDMADYSSSKAPWGDNTSTSSGYNVNSIVITEGVTRIGDKAFQLMNFHSVKIPGSVETIGKNAFYFCNEFTTLAIPEGVVVIGDYAFDNCRKLAYVSLPAGLEIIGRHAFSTTNLTSIVIPGTVKEIGAFAFYNTELTGIEIPSSVTTIGEAAFMLIDELTSVEIPDNVTNIGTRLFESCYNLVSVKLPSNMKEIPYRMFWYCHDLTDITIPSTVTKIDSDAFWYATSLAQINIPSGVKEIGNGVFGHTALTTINIPASMETIGEGAFRTESLESINVAGGNQNYKSIDGVLYSKDMTEFICYPAAKAGETYAIPNGVEIIHKYAFHYAKGLTSLTIPRTVVKTYSDNGYDCSYCTNLEDIYYKGTSEEWSKINGIKSSGFGKKTVHYHESHTMSDWTVDSAANCQVTGEKSRYCTYDCGYTETATIPVVAHAMGNWYTSKNPTCTAKGQSKRDCTYGCGTSETKDISATGHKDGNPYDGYCDVCGAETDAVKDCSCNCHKGGFMGFIWKIMSFFQKLFKTNQTCACGMAHY